MPPPHSGPCAPWVDSSEVADLSWVKAASQKWLAEAEDRGEEALAAIIAEATAAASEILYELSGRVYTGDCGPITVRPVARPSDMDTRGIRGLLGGSWFYAWGGGSGSGASPYVGTVSGYGRTDPPSIFLGAYPVVEIIEVKIDGVVIPANEYQLRDYQELIRMLPTASAQPTERYGWPTSQRQDLPDTQEGTFSVTYRYGSPPPTSGVIAARKLSEYLALPQLGDTTKYPQRVTSVQRQGISAMVVDVMDIVKTGRTGIYEVDLFLRSVNPTQNARQAAVWSPDVGRPRRTP